MSTVDISSDHPFVSESEPNVFTCFASDVGALRGDFPIMLTNDFGNKNPLYRITRKVVDGDTQYVRYRQYQGCIELIVYND